MMEKRQKSKGPTPERNSNISRKTEMLNNNNNKKNHKYKALLTCASKHHHCQTEGQTYLEAVVVAEAAGKGIVQIQKGCGQGKREVWQLAQIWRELGEKAQTEWNSVWHSGGHL